jgi:hypothetical protein
MIGMVGMQWFDEDSRKELTEKVRQAMEYYQKKYGKRALIVLVSAKNSDGVDFEKLSKDFTVIVKPSSLLPVHHLWIGEETAEQQETLA